jgi:hypothetical protein
MQNISPQAPATNPAEAFKSQRYVVLPQILTPQTTMLATRYALMKAQLQRRTEDDTQLVPGSHHGYGDHLMESLLDCVTQPLEGALALGLWRTYSYYRVYEPGAVLRRHRDRPACEISVTLCLGYRYGSEPNAPPWPIYVNADGPEGGPGKAIALGPGDALIYRGCEVEHWREALRAPPGSWHAQVFLHYVTKDGPYAQEWRYDRRKGLGLPSVKSSPAN